MTFSDDLSLTRRPLRGRLLLFLLSGILLIIGIGNPPVSRTQEARVLETARQMLNQPAEKWLIPELNGDVRLQKPPFAYWYTAGGFMFFGENEFAGRLPTALLAWMALLVIYLTGSQLFDPRIGLLSSAMLLGSYLFARHSRLAETDLPATLFTTLAVLTVIRAGTNRSSLADFHLFALSVGMVILAKGGPAVFSLLFLISVVIIEKRWDLLRRFVVSGAIITLLVVSLPWFIYAIGHHGFETFLRELRNTAEGGDHSNSALEYLAVLAWGAAPWSIALPFALYQAAKRWKSDRNLRTTLLWMACIAVPLLLNGNKQKHYLLPMLPAVMVLAAWWIDVCWKQVKPATLVAGVLAIVLPLSVTLLVPQLKPDVSRRIAERISHDRSQADLRFYGENYSPVLSFNMRKRIPIVEGDVALNSLSSDAILLVIGKEGRPVVAPPAPFAQVEQFVEGGQTYVLYRRP